MENFVITIGREFGSGGLDVGRMLSKQLNVNCYDKELLAMAAKESGLCQEIFESHDEKPTNSFLYSLVMDTYSFGYSSAAFTDMPINHKVFLAQFEAVKKLAAEGPCVMVGRCADYALSELSNCFSVFIHSDMESRIRRIAQKYGMKDNKARDAIQKTDKSRSSYYNYYTNKRWGDASSYHLSIDSGKLGIDQTVECIIQTLKVFETPV